MRRFEISPSLVISLVALFVALGGGAYAALGPNSVGSTQLKRGAVTAPKIHPNAVGARQIKDGSIGPRELSGNLPGSLVAYALITPDGVVPGKSRGITDSNVRTLPLSQFCLSGLPRFSTAMVSPSSNGERAVIANLELPPASFNSCGDLDSTKKYIAVTTMSGIGDGPITWSEEPFYIYLFR